MDNFWTLGAKKHKTWRMKLVLLLLPSLIGLLGALPLTAETSSSAVYRLMVTLTATSDWTAVGFEEVPMGAFISRIEEGSDAPNLSIKRGPDLGLEKKRDDETKVVIDFEAYLDLGTTQGAWLTLKISKGWLGFTEVDIYNCNQDEVEFIGSFTHEGVADPSDPDNKREFTVSKDQISRGGPLPARSFNKMVLSFYYPWYGTPNGPSGCWHAWDPSYPEYGSVHTPLAGYYDSWDKATIRRHIKEAREAGINGFIVSWWGIDSFEDKTLKDILTIAEEEFFSITIYYEVARSIDQAVDDFKYILQRYSSSPAFLKIDNVPVIFVYGRVILSFQEEDWTFLFQRLEEEDLRCFCIGDWLGISFYIADDSLDFLFELFQGVHTYIPVSIPVKEIRELYGVNALRARGRNVLFAATVVPGYDDTIIRNPGFVQDRQEGMYYRQTWEAAIASKPDWVLMTSFNEWLEGTEIEPSVEFGRQYLEITRELGNLWNPLKKLKIMAEVGGTTDPKPGTYTFYAGNEAAVTAIPSLHYRFKGWSGDASGLTNPITITMDINKTIKAKFQIIYPPLNFSGQKVLNRSLSQAEYINILKWKANPNNVNIIKYRIYLIERNNRNLLVELDSNTFDYWHRKVEKYKVYTYALVAVNDEGREGVPAPLTIK